MAVTIRPDGNLWAALKREFNVPDAQIPGVIERMEVMPGNKFLTFDPQRFQAGATYETPPDLQRNIPALDESYAVGERDIQADASSKLNEMTLLRALSEQEWRLKKKRMIDADNKMELAYSLYSGKRPNLMPYSVSSGASSSSGLKAKGDIEKTLLTNEWLKNPARTKDQVLEFGTSMNASPVGWAYIKNTLAPLFDYGDEVQWKKLMPDGSVKYAYSRKHDVERNALFRSEQYRIGSLEDDRKTKAAASYKQAAKSLTDFLGDNPLTQERLDEYTKNNPEMFFNKDMAAAIENIAGLFDLTPTMVVFIANKDYKDRNGQQRKKGEKFSIRVGTEGYKKELDNQNSSRLSETEEFKFDQNKIHTEEIDGATADMDAIMEKEEVQKDNDIIEDRINELLQKRASQNPLFIPKEGDAKTVMSKLGLTELRTQLEGTLYDIVDTMYVDGKTLKDIRKAISEQGKGNVSDKTMKEVDEYIDGKFKQPELAEIIDTETVMTFPIVLPDGTTEYIPANVKGKMVRLGDATTGELDVPLMADTPQYRILPKVTIKTDSEGNKTLVQVAGQFTQSFKIAHMQKEQENIGKAVTALIRKPTEYWDAYNSYNQIYDQIDVGVPDPSAWASVDQRIVTLAIKLVDTSMVTESEFESFADKAGIGDKIRHQLRKWRTGEPITAGQKRAILKMTEQWLKTKQKAIKGVATSLKETLDTRYPESENIILPRGYKVLDLFNIAGASFDLMNEVPRPSEGLMTKSPEHKKFFGIEEEDKTTGAYDGAGSAGEALDRSGLGDKNLLITDPRRQLRAPRLQ